MSFLPGSIGVPTTEQAGTTDYWQDQELSALENNRTDRLQRIGYVLFLLCTAITFNPPSELIPSIQGWPLFQILILSALVASYQVVFGQLTWARLTRTPSSLCVIGIAVAIFLSGIANLDFYGARTGAVDFLKNVTYFLMLLGLVNTEARLRNFLKFVILMITLMSLISMLGYFGYIHTLTPTMLKRGDGDFGGIDPVTGAPKLYTQLQAIGVFSDPNDFSLVLVLALLGTGHFIMEAKSLLWRFLWLIPAIVLAVAFALTRSRGGLLSLLAGVAVWLISRFGWKRALAILMLVMPLIFIAFAGRQTDINLSADDTAQSRIRLWRDGMGFIKGAPVFGIGYYQFGQRADNVAHNSYIHCYAELGFIGGTLFFGCFALPLISIASGATQRRLRALADFVLPRAFLRNASYPVPFLLPNSLSHLRSTMIAIGIGYAVGLFSLSRAYVISTYQMLGMLCAMQVLIAMRNPSAVPRLTNRLVGMLILASFCWLVFLYVFVRIAVRGGH